MAEHVASLCPPDAWEGELSSNELSHLVGGISKQNVHGEACFFLVDCGKIQEEGDKGQ